MPAPFCLKSARYRFSSAFTILSGSGLRVALGGVVEAVVPQADDKAPHRRGKILPAGGQKGVEVPQGKAQDI